MKFIFIPVSVLVFALFLIMMFFPTLFGETGQMIVMGVALVGFIVVNVVVNKKVEEQELRDIRVIRKLEELLDKDFNY